MMVAQASELGRTQAEAWKAGALSKGFQSGQAEHPPGLGEGSFGMPSVKVGLPHAALVIEDKVAAV